MAAGKSRQMFDENLTIVQVDDNDDDIFLTHHQFLRSELPGRFLFQTKPEEIFTTLDELVTSGTSVDQILLLLDISMPRFDGFEMLQKIRSHHDYSALTVIMLSNSNSEDDKLKAFSAGCDGYLVKPFKIEDLYRAVPGVPYSRMRLPLQA